jgi:flagellar motor switch/type III secretory pathway protein FliN
MTEGAGVALVRTGIVPPALEKDVETSAMSRIEQHNQWVLLARLPLKLQVAVPLPGFRVRDLLALREGKTISSVWLSSEDVPLNVGGVQLAWSEFEVVEQRLAVRLTRLG